MTFNEAVKDSLQKYATFSGRSGRSEFWWFGVFQVLALLVGWLLGAVVLNLVSLALLLPSLAICARRQHDVGKSGWWMLLLLVPLVQFLVIYWWCLPSDGPNQYGSPEVTPFSTTFMPPGRGGPGQQ
jgi:uncharacterized membrane protein YhaH (DUF805 family)